MPEPPNVLAKPLETCSSEPRSGFVRGDDDGETVQQAIGSHTLCDRADLKDHPVALS